MTVLPDQSTSTQYRIRPVETAQIADLIRIGQELNLSPWTAACYLDEMKNVDSVMHRLVSEDHGTVGFVVGRFVPPADGSAAADAEIYNIAVNASHQKQGLGQMLFDAFAASCEARNVGNIWLEVRESNSKAISFYEKNGFLRVQTRRHFYSDPREHAVLMKLSLKQTNA